MSEIKNSGECWDISDNLLRVEGVSIKINSIDSVKFYTPWWASLAQGIVVLFLLLLIIADFVDRDFTRTGYLLGIMFFFGVMGELVGIDIEYLSIVINGEKHIVTSTTKDKKYDLFKMKQAIEQKLSTRLIS